MFKAHQTKLLFLNGAKQQRKGNMEALVLAIIAARNLYRHQEAPEPEKEFQSFHLRELGHLYSAKDKSPSRLSDRQAPCVAQATYLSANGFDQALSFDDASDVLANPGWLSNRP